jgi:hypothetical protein
MSGVEVTGMREWIAALKYSAAQIEDHGKRIVGQGCNNIKKDWRARWTGYSHIPHLPRTLNYEVNGGTTIVGTVWPRREMLQGKLASYIEFGTIYSGPIPGGQPALDAEEPRFVAAVEDLAIRLLE